MKNLHILEDIVGTKYNDMEGCIAIDGHDGADLFTLCKDHGIDMESYFLFGFGLSEFTIDGIGQDDSVECKVLLLSKEKYGNTFDEISKNISGLPSVSIVEKTFYIEYTALGKYIKRFDFMTVSKMSQYISSINIKEEE